MSKGSNLASQLTTHDGPCLSDYPRDVENFLEQQLYLNEWPKSKLPLFLAVGGPTASGKSSFLLSLRAQCLVCPQSYFLPQLVCDPDIALHSLSGFQKDIELLGAAQATSKWELCARELANLLLEKACQQALPLCYARSFGLPDSYETAAWIAKLPDYEREIHFLDIALPDAIAREEARAQSEQRKITSETIQERFRYYYRHRDEARKYFHRSFTWRSIRGEGFELLEQSQESTLPRFIPLPPSSSATIGL